MASTVLLYGVPGFFLLSFSFILLSELVKEPYTWSVGGAVIDNGSQIISMLVPTLLRVLVLPVGLVCTVVWGVLNRGKVEAWMNGKSRQAAMKRK